MLVVTVWIKACECECVAMVKRRREERVRTCLDWIVHWCCGGCTAVLCTLDYFPLSSTSSCQCFCFVLHCANAPHCHALCCCEHLCFLSRSLSLPSRTYTRVHCDTKPFHFQHLPPPLPIAPSFLPSVCICSLQFCRIGVDGARAIGAAVPKDRQFRLLLWMCVM